jgi:tetratricopeptide (TPR) repeat protein
VPFELAWVSPFFSQADDRFVRAELLARLGRDREALHWFGGFEENSVYDLVYAAPARLRRGEILERLGEREAAIAEYRRVVELWSGGDDDAGRAVADVQARIRRLLGGG